MTTPGGEGTEVELEAPTLDGVRLGAFERLLEMSARLVELGRHRSDFEPLNALANAVAENACALAGMPTALDSAVAGHVVLVIQLERSTTKLWNAKVLAPSEKAVMIYHDGPSRAAALANGLVLLARTVLEREPLPEGLVGGTASGPVTAETAFADALGGAMDDYEENLGALNEVPEWSFHGEGGVD